MKQTKYKSAIKKLILRNLTHLWTNASVLIGKQYQNHNSKPGPIYSNGGYTLIAKAIAKFIREINGGKDQNETSLAKLLD